MLITISFMIIHNTYIQLN